MPQSRDFGRHSTSDDRGLAKGLIALIVVLVLAAVAFAVYALFLRDDAPEKPSVSRTVEALDSTSGGTQTETGGDVSGTWNIDADTGEVAFDSATGSFVGFRVSEELSQIGSATAVGRTRGVRGSIEIDGTKLKSVSVTADMTQIRTNQSRRDPAVQRSLETTTFGEATFVSTGEVDLGSEAASGSKSVAVEVPGTLTVHGVSKEVTISVEAQLSSGVVVVAGTSPVKLSDFGVEAPKAPVVLSVSDDAEIEFQLLFVKA